MSAESHQVAPLWEQLKENAAPLERGRSVAVLEQAMTHNETNQRQHEQAIEQFENLISLPINDDNKDPILHWIAYIKYQQDMGTIQDQHSHFLLLERCFRSILSSSERKTQYSNDPRFIRICCMYADKTSRPSDIFNYMYQQKIGKHVAIFWAAWAFVAEKEKDFPFAEKIFSKGIRNKAHPAQYLATRHKQFQRRMSRYWLNSSTTHHGAGPDDDDVDDVPQRRGVLGGLTEDAISRNDRAQYTRQGSFRRAPSAANPQTFGMRGASRGTLNNASNTNHNSISTGFEIFTDDVDENAVSILDQSFVPNDERVLEREQDRLKENTVGAERWNQRGGLAETSTMYSSSFSHQPQSVASTPALAPFAIHVDDECAAQHEREELEKQALEEQHRKARDERKLVLVPRGGDAMAEKLAQDPLLYIRNPEQLEKDKQLVQQHDAELEAKLKQPLKQLATTLTSRRQTRENHRSGSLQPRGIKVSSGSRSTCGFNKHLLKNAAGLEQCFEEARIEAGCYKSQHRGSSNINLFALAKKELDESAMSIDTSMDTSKALPTPVSVTSCSYNGLPRRGGYTPQNCSVASSDCGAGGAPPVQDPTINTQLALKELSMMFSSPAFPTANDRSQDASIGPIRNLNDMTTEIIISEPPQFPFSPKDDETKEGDDATVTIEGLADLMAGIEQSVSLTPRDN